MYYLDGTFFPIVKRIAFCLAFAIFASTLILLGPAASTAEASGCVGTTSHSRHYTSIPNSATYETDVAKLSSCDAKKMAKAAAKNSGRAGFAAAAVGLIPGLGLTGKAFGAIIGTQGFQWFHNSNSLEECSDEFSQGVEVTIINGTVSECSAQ